MRAILPEDKQSFADELGAYVVASIGKDKGALAFVDPLSKETILVLIMVLEWKLLL
jgi:hypothetical protein